jgi:hypothetical protein
MIQLNACIFLTVIRIFFKNSGLFFSVMNKKHHLNITVSVTLNACLVLALFLPKPKRVYPFERKMSPIARVEDLFHIVPVGNLAISGSV